MVTWLASKEAGQGLPFLVNLASPLWTPPLICLHRGHCAQNSDSIPHFYYVYLFLVHTDSLTPNPDSRGELFVGGSIGTFKNKTSESGALLVIIITTRAGGGTRGKNRGTAGGLASVTSPEPLDLAIAE